MFNIEFTPDSMITRVNANFLQATGYHHDELRGRHHSMLPERVAHEHGIQGQQATAAQQSLQRLWPAHELAPQVGAVLGAGEILFRALPTAALSHERTAADTGRSTQPTAQLV